jgi:hypothetical protein
MAAKKKNDVTVIFKSGAILDFEAFNVEILLDDNNAPVGYNIDTGGNMPLLWMDPKDISAIVAHKKGPKTN